MPFIGKVILITGASSGIGAACAKYFAKKGALLALVARNADKFQNFIENLKKCGVEFEPMIILADVRVDAGRIVSETVEMYGHLDILINNAGISISGSLENMTMQDYDAMMANNVRGAVELTKYAMPHLIASKGNIINVSSALGIIPSETCLAYSMSKAGLDQFTKCLAVELASKGVRVNSINPGAIDDNENQSDKYDAEIRLKHPIIRIATKNDCVQAIAFLADENASCITGVLFPVDGGLSIKGAF